MPIVAKASTMPESMMPRLASRRGPSHADQDATEAALSLDERAAARAGFRRDRFEVETAHDAAGPSPAYDLAGHHRGAGGTQVTVVDEGVGSQFTKGSE